MPASVVTISAQTGTNGYAIARGVAEALNFRYYDWEITMEAASRAGVSPDQVIAAERIPSFIERIMNRLSTIPAVSVESMSTVNEPSATMWSNAVQGLSSDAYRQFIEKIVLEMAQVGEAVIVGHAAQHTLRDQPGVLRVLLHGSLERRSERVAAEQNISLDQARTGVRESDRQRGELFKRVYQFDWNDATMYELILNTDKIASDFAIETITAAAKALS
jgi:cytidylate kinase